MKGHLGDFNTDILNPLPLKYVAHLSEIETIFLNEDQF